MLPHHCSSLKEVRAGTWKQELMQRPGWVLFTGLFTVLFSVACSAYCLIHLRTIFLGNGINHNEVGLFYQLARQPFTDMAMTDA